MKVTPKDTTDLMERKKGKALNLLYQLRFRLQETCGPVDVHVLRTSRRGGGLTRSGQDQRATAGADAAAAEGGVRQDEQRDLLDQADAHGAAAEGAESRGEAQEVHGVPGRRGAAGRAGQADRGRGEEAAPAGAPQPADQQAAVERRFHGGVEHEQHRGVGAQPQEARREREPRPPVQAAPGREGAGLHHPRHPQGQGRADRRDRAVRAHPPPQAQASSPRRRVAPAQGLSQRGADRRLRRAGPRAGAGPGGGLPDVHGGAADGGAGLDDGRHGGARAGHSEEHRETQENERNREGGPRQPHAQADDPAARQGGGTGELREGGGPGRAHGAQVAAGGAAELRDLAHAEHEDHHRGEPQNARGEVPEAQRAGHGGGRHEGGRGAEGPARRVPRRHADRPRARERDRARPAEGQARAPQGRLRGHGAPADHALGGGLHAPAEARRARLRPAQLARVDRALRRGLPRQGQLRRPVPRAGGQGPRPRRHARPLREPEEHGRRPHLRARRAAPLRPLGASPLRNGPRGGAGQCLLEPARIRGLPAQPRPVGRAPRRRQQARLRAARRAAGGGGRRAWEARRGWRQAEGRGSERARPTGE